MHTFSIRPYSEESDFNILYNFQNDNASKTVAFQLSGASPFLSEEKFRLILQNACKNSSYPFVVADDNNHPIGISMVDQYIRIAKHHTFHITLWERSELMEQVLHQTLYNIFSGGTVEMAICKVYGYEKDLLNACKKMDLEQVGCIPDYFCYEGLLYPEYTFIAKRNKIKL